MDLWWFIENFKETPYEHKEFTKSKMVRIVETGLEFPSIGACARYLGRQQRSVSRVLNGANKKCAGYTFEFIEDQTEKEDDEQ